MMIENWLIKTDAFKDAVNQLMDHYKDREDTVVLSHFLQKLLHLNADDIQKASVEKIEELV
jgi:hypothetical protein